MLSNPIFNLDYTLDNEQTSQILGARYNEPTTANLDLKNVTLSIPINTIQ